MKKVLNGTLRNFMWYGYDKPARITCTITDEDGYISITADIIPYRCRTPHICGCCHAEVGKAFPWLKKYLWLHGKYVDSGLDTYQFENGLYNLMNGKADYFQYTCHLTDAEMLDITALVEYGLHKCKRWGFYTADDNTKEVFKKNIEKYHIPQRALNAMQEFYKVLEKH